MKELEMIWLLLFFNECNRSETILELPSIKKALTPLLDNAMKVSGKNEQ
jgi:hypothetical protein